MSQTELEADNSEKPLSPQQLAFARYLGIAIAKGGRDAELVEAYVAAGYAANRGNARRLAADPRVKAIAEKACADELEVIGLRIGYLQAKALELLHASPTEIFRAIKLHQAAQFNPDISAEKKAELDLVLDKITWPLTEFKIDKDGVIAIKLPDKKALIEMLAKQLGVGKDDNSVNVGVTLEALVAQSLQAKERAA
jgi:hypothetical protein